MTPRISLVAVCCSNDFLEFLKQPHVLDGDNRLVGEGFEKLDLRRGKGTHLGATRAQRSNEFPLLTKGNEQEGARAAGGTQHWEIILRAGVGNVERAMLAHPAKLWFINTDLVAATGMGPKCARGTNRSPRGVAAPHHRSRKPARRSRRWRRAPAARPSATADDAEHFGVAV